MGPLGIEEEIGVALYWSTFRKESPEEANASLVANMALEVSGSLPPWHAGVCVNGQEVVDQFSTQDLREDSHPPITS